ncbi:head-tail adaptor protein [Rhizobium sp. PP-CC-3G-465]|uniref:head-tail adaptor protein n=1 Tax=Rhizobium sp. PP-CC-3G-465 TaxID=2135648 RepID=UPI00104D80AA|nr:head-tail adaptor [Rhizobium sp. PP-CC-3G-465]
MTVNVSELDRRITLQRASKVANAFNEETSTWLDLAKEWARRRDASDSQKVELLAAGQVGSFRVSRFTVRSSNITRSITPVDRLLHEGVIWQINGVKELDEGRHRFIEITASRDADNG